MRKFIAGMALLGLVLAACAEEGTTPQGTGGSSEQSCQGSDLPVLEEGTLTVATDKPAYEPWFKGSLKNYSGFEGELASNIAEGLDLDIKWVVEPFNKSYAPGAKDYDFDINQITITPERERAVDFSDGYFVNNQGVLALEGSPIAESQSIEDLKDYQLGAQVGTTSLSLINGVIQPTSETKVFDTTNDSRSALENGQIDALVTDVVTTVYLRDIEIENSVVVGQYPEEEQFGMVFEQGNPLRRCVNEVLAELKSDGTLEQLEKKWLQAYLDVPPLE